MPEIRQIRRACRDAGRPKCARLPRRPAAGTSPTANSISPATPSVVVRLSKPTSSSVEPANIAAVFARHEIARAVVDDVAQQRSLRMEQARSGRGSGGPPARFPAAGGFRPTMCPKSRKQSRRRSCRSAVRTAATRSPRVSKPCQCFIGRISTPRFAQAATRARRCQGFRNCASPGSQ